MKRNESKIIAIIREEYVNRIDGDEENMVVYLREPEVPRIDPPSAAQRMNETDAETESMPDEPTLSLDKHDDLEQDLEQEGVFPVSAEEFKKEYIVD